MTIDGLPDECICQILSHLNDCRSLGVAAQTCRRWSLLARELVWSLTAEADQLLLIRRDYAQAQDLYDRVLTLHPNFVPALVGVRYRVLSCSGEWGKGEEALQRAREAGEAAQKEAYAYYQHWCPSPSRPPSPHRIAATDSTLHEEPVQSWQSLPRPFPAWAAFLRGAWMDVVCDEGPQAFPWYQAAANAGLCQGCHNVGWLYARGSGVEQDLEEAVTWYRKGAAAAYPPSWHNLGVCAAYGRGMDRDMHEAARWWAQAAHRGLAVAQHNLAICYTHGNGVERDYIMAAHWYRHAAEQGNLSACVHLAQMLEEGRGMERNFELAAMWYRKAAESGAAAAEHGLGELYERGWGVKQDLGQAAEWFRRAAEQDYTPGMVSLAAMWEGGYGVPMDVDEAIRWYRRAAMQGNEDARDALLRLGEGE